MHKIVIQTQSLGSRRETPFRKMKGFDSQQVNKQGSIYSEDRGRIHVYNSYRQQLKAHEVVNNLVANQIDIKTQVLFLNHLLRPQLQSLMIHLKQRQENVQLVDMVFQQQQANHINLIIYCKTILASEQIFQIALFNFHTLPLYIKEAIFIQSTITKDNHQQLVLLVNQQPLPQNKPEKLNIVYNQRWIQIPRCIDCLQKLQYELTGISIQLFHQLIKNNRISCKTCLIINKITQGQTSCCLCESHEDNWICMVCSSVGCGRYKNGDAFKHFLCDGHIITMDLQTQRVWNYLSDCFSHRVIPLEKQQITLKFPDFSQKKNDIKYEESLQSAFWEYCSVVSEELQRQRIFYQKQKLEEEQRFKQQNTKADKLLLDLTLQLQQNTQILKKANKKQKKNEKRLQQLRQKCKLDRQVLSNYENMIRQDSKSQSLEEIQTNSQKIQQKLKILQSIEIQIQNILIKLTQC